MAAAAAAAAAPAAPGPAPTAAAGTKRRRPDDGGENDGDGASASEWLLVRKDGRSFRVPAAGQPPLALGRTTAAGDMGVSRQAATAVAAADGASILVTHIVGATPVYLASATGAGTLHATLLPDTATAVAEHARLYLRYRDGKLEHGLSLRWEPRAARAVSEPATVSVSVDGVGHHGSGSGGSTLLTNPGAPPLATVAVAGHPCWRQHRRWCPQSLLSFLLLLLLLPPVAARIVTA